MNVRFLNGSPVVQSKKFSQPFELGGSRNYLEVKISLCKCNLTAKISRKVHRD